MGSSVLAAGALPHIGPVGAATVRGLPRWAQHPVQREPSVDALVRDATRMLEILATARAPASPLDLCLAKVNGDTHAAMVRRDPLQREREGHEAAAGSDGGLSLRSREMVGLNPTMTVRRKAAAVPTEPQDPVHRERVHGPLRNGNPRGNPNLAPRCGAKTRLGCPCKSPAMANGRCRMHGGASTGPKTAEGKARIAAASARRGNQEARACEARATATIRRGKVLAATVDARLPLEALAVPLRALPGAPAAQADDRLFVADALLHRALTGAETRQLVADIRAMAALAPRKAMQRERQSPGQAPRRDFFRRRKPFVNPLPSCCPPNPTG